MSKIACISLGILSIVFILAGRAYADDQGVFVSKCGPCHRSGGEAKVFAPSKFASIQWERFFDRDKHSRYKDIKKQITSHDMAAVKVYLMDHAADSDTPMAIGLR